MRIMATKKQKQVKAERLAAAPVGAPTYQELAAAWNQTASRPNDSVAFRRMMGRLCSAVRAEAAGASQPPPPQPATPQPPVTSVYEPPSAAKPKDQNITLSRVKAPPKAGPM